MTTLYEILDRAYRTTEPGTKRAGWENCSGFVRMAAAALRIKLEGQRADDQLKYMERHWIRLKGGMHALEVASQGFFVVAGLQSTEYEPPRTNGHIVVVQPLTPARMPVGPEDLRHGRYPYVWGGDYDRQLMSRGERAITGVINQKVRDKVRYYTPPIAGPHTPPFQ